ncbi:cytochrome c biogenesis protein [Paenibacillus cellulosilyticus]|uniref:Cytochrome c biogenesis protein n=1 Tax=Paenibacillus cellulosilyticus TaxID=375489 RepID=A0A2V2Z552_9BACL|nr:cytochrome c biogenesis protein ResB [Paenibacillus cellulosilyticus]PWW05589.1 cytochrome c biogenesis protein [Paenibacillus cellulosilyticus]QKS45378.1 cytochrome c biogenesis protein ResB [Paenibacillus cellulosilyticus]
MFQNTKCECGHQNPPDTLLCESCGKPLVESDEPLEMRYDGVARRSQKQNPNPLDRVWNFFSSVRIAVIIIIITLVGASLGTIYPQGNDADYYKEAYGWSGELYHAIGLSSMYDSWWFVGLLVMIGTSLVICSLDRVLPLYRALNKQQIRKHLQFITRQKTSYTGSIEGDAEQWVQTFGNQLKRRRYKVHINGTALLAEKNRFSRWGPYINHIGLIILLLALLARTIPHWTEENTIAVRDGETVQVSGTDYYVKNEKFTVEYYTETELPERLKQQQRPKLYETHAVLYECVKSCGEPGIEPELKEVKQYDITVNHPMSYSGVKLYQIGYDDSPLLQSVSPVIEDVKTGQTYGPFELPMKNPKTNFEVGPYTLELKANYMEFALDEDGSPITKSRDPKSPAFIFIVKGPGLDEKGEPYMYFPLEKDKERFSQDQINQAVASKVQIRVDGMENVKFSSYTSYLLIRVDRALPYVWVGLGICMLGLLMGAYWHHRRIWLRIDDGKLSLGAHTNKNHFGMRSETAWALEQMGITVERDKLDNGGYNS